MSVTPQRHWRIVDEWKDAYGSVLAYRLRCSTIYFDKNHIALTKEQLTGFLGEEEVMEDYPSTAADVRSQLQRDFKLDAITSNIREQARGMIYCSASEP